MGRLHTAAGRSCWPANRLPARAAATAAGAAAGKKSLKLSVVGSSITALQGVADARNGYPDRIVDMLTSAFPAAGKVGRCGCCQGCAREGHAAGSGL